MTLFCVRKGPTGSGKGPVWLPDEYETVIKFGPKIRKLDWGGGLVQSQMRFTGINIGNLVAGDRSTTTDPVNSDNVSSKQ